MVEAPLARWRPPGKRITEAPVSPGPLPRKNLGARLNYTGIRRSACVGNFPATVLLAPGIREVYPPNKCCVLLNVSYLANRPCSDYALCNAFSREVQRICDMYAMHVPVHQCQCYGDP